MHDDDCACCGTTGAGFSAILAREDADIEEHGFHYSLVFGNEDVPGFIYTSGLAEKGLPEFIFIGSSEPRSHMYIAAFIAFVRNGGDVQAGLVPPTGEQGPNPFAVPAWVLDANDRLETHAYGVEARLRRIHSSVEPRLLQVVMPDLKGRFPWQPGYDWLDQDIHEPPIAVMN